MMRETISIHPPRAGRDVAYLKADEWSKAISIHPPRAGRDFADTVTRAKSRCISIHPPRAGRDKYGLKVCGAEIAFQSTRPVRGGTVCAGADPH